MLYIVPGLLAGVAFYLVLAVVSWGIERIWSAGRRLRAHTRLHIHCLVAIVFGKVLAVAGGGGNWAPHLQLSGFLLAGCLLSTVTAARDKAHLDE